MIENEIDKWTNKIKEVVDKIETDNQEMLKNMKAYIEDSKHFKENRDFLRSFECIVWAWAIFETCRELGIFKLKR
ncbi:MAG: DUF357 domain-containing protein [Candidatus Aenigmatarchaeota archaeon]